MINYELKKNVIALFLGDPIDLESAPYDGKYFLWDYLWPRDYKVIEDFIHMSYNES